VKPSIVSHANTSHITIGVRRRERATFACTITAHRYYAHERNNALKQ